MSSVAEKHKDKAPQTHWICDCKDMKVVWDLIDGKNTCADIIAAVKKQYPNSDIVETKVAEIFDVLSKYRAGGKTYWMIM